MSPDNKNTRRKKTRARASRATSRPAAAEEAAAAEVSATVAEPPEPPEPDGGGGGDTGGPGGGPGVEPGKLRRLLVSAARTLAPLAEGYGRATPDGEVASGDAGTLSAAERSVYKAAAAKLVVEAGELLLANYPVTPEGTAVVRAERDPETGRYSAPTLAFAVAAGKALAARGDAREAARAARPVAYDHAQPASAAVEVVGSPPAASERASAAPIPVNDLRILAMSNRANPSTTYLVQPVTRRASHESRGRLVATTRAVEAARAVSPRRGGCSGCGAASASDCGCGGLTAQPARAVPAEDDGWFSVAPGTRARLKSCIADTLCDLLRCIDHTFCADGKLDFRTLGADGDKLIDCLGTAACSLLHCIPEALCPPEEEVCSPAPRAGLPCNFAVEETR